MANNIFLGFVLMNHRAYEVRWDFLNIRVGSDIIGSATVRDMAQKILRDWVKSKHAILVKGSSEIPKGYVIIRPKTEGGP